MSKRSDGVPVMLNTSVVPLEFSPGDKGMASRASGRAVPASTWKRATMHSAGIFFIVGEDLGDSCLCVPAHVNFPPICRSFREIFSCITWLREAACSCLVGIVRAASASDLLGMIAKSLTFNFCCNCSYYCFNCGL